MAIMLQQVAKIIKNRKPTSMLLQKLDYIEKSLFDKELVYKQICQEYNTNNRTIVKINKGDYKEYSKNDLILRNKTLYKLLTIFGVDVLF